MHMCLLEACEPLCRHFENLKGELKKMLGMHKYMCVCIYASVWLMHASMACLCGIYGYSWKCV